MLRKFLEIVAAQIKEMRRVFSVRFRNSQSLNSGRVKRHIMIGAVGSVVFGLAFLLGFFTLNSQKPDMPSSAESQQYTSSITVVTSGIGGSTGSNADIDFNIETTPDGAVDAKKQIVNVKTNAKYGYKLYISSGDNNTALIKEGSSGGIGQKIEPVNSPLDPINGNMASDLSMNSWGYAIPRNAENGFALNSFSETYDLGAIIAENTGVGKWKGVSPKNSPVLIAKTNRPENINGKNIEVYFAAKANSAIDPGKYHGSVVYTVIIEQPAKGFGGIDEMQKMTPEICRMAKEHQVGELSDVRDGKKYKVVKAKDGNCWMADNLALDLYVGSTLTRSDTDLPANKPSWTPENSTVGHKGDLWNTGSNDPGRDYKKYERTNARSFRPSLDEPGNSDGRYGVLYNWYAATAGTTDNNFNTKGSEALGSICPKGWQLPRREIVPINKSYAKLFSFYDSMSALTAAPLSFVLSGRYVGSMDDVSDPDITYQNADYHAFFWTGTVSSYDRSYGSTTYGLHPSEPAIDRTEGLAVRCVARTSTKTIEDIVNMQDVTPEICRYSPEHAIAVLNDARDGKHYKVVKAKDGNCWMTENLALELSNAKPLNNINSDLPENKPVWTPENNTQVNDGEEWNVGSSDSSADSGSQYKIYERTHARSFKIPDAAAGNSRKDYGVLYNWYAATAGTTDNKFNYQGERAPGSICPKGWQLPNAKDANSNKSFAKLYKSYNPGYNGSGSYNGSGALSYLTQSPLNFVLSGAYMPFVAQGYIEGGESGFYWTNELRGNVAARSIHLTSAGFSNNLSGDNRIGGLSVRCVARTFEDIYDFDRMQDVSIEGCRNTATGAERTLRDIRDDKNYKIIKASDGNCWMTENLALELSTDKTFTKDDTDLTAARDRWSPENNTQNDSGVSWAVDSVSADEYEFNNSRSYKIPNTVNNNEDGKYGILYNWHAATAGYKFSSGSIWIGQPSADSSICPKGWMLPSGGMDKSIGGTFARLKKYYSNRELIDYDIKIGLSGLYNQDGQYIESGQNGYYWTMSFNNQFDFESLNLKISRNYFNSNLSTVRNYGMAIRCLVKSGFGDNGSEVTE